MNAEKVMKVWIAEFVGVFTLVAAGVGSIVAGAGLVGIALAHGIAIGVMVAATAKVSGGHLNPAVSLGLFLIGKMDFYTMLRYWSAQIVGGVTAALMLMFLFGSHLLNPVGHGAPQLAAGITPFMGVGLEALVTFFLVFVIVGAAVHGAQAAAPLYIGLTISMGILAVGPFTGAAINPARALGPALMAGAFANQWVYWVGAFLGAAAAAFLANYIYEPSESYSVEPQVKAVTRA